MRKATKPTRRITRSKAFSLIELLVTLPIIALLLTATMMAIDASFKAYGSAAEQASAQAGTRMIVHRLLTLIRTSTAHGPLLPTSGPPEVTIDGDILSSPYIELMDQYGNIVRIEWRETVQELWVIQTPAAGGENIEQPLIGGVTNATFLAKRRRNDAGVWVLERATVDLTIQPGEDATLAVENGSTPPIRVIASTMPRKLE